MRKLKRYIVVIGATAAIATTGVVGFAAAQSPAPKAPAHISNTQPTATETPDTSEKPDVGEKPDAGEKPDVGEAPGGHEDPAGNVDHQCDGNCVE